MPDSTPEFLRAELARLDLLLHREILRLRAHYRLSQDEFRGLYVSDQQVDALVRNINAESGLAGVTELTAQAALLRDRNYADLSPSSTWTHLASEFQLSPFELDVLLLALAPEIELKYETLYAYLHNDVTRKRPTCELALRLFGRRLVPDSTLFRDGLLHATPAEALKLLGLEFTVAPTVARHLLDLDPPESLRSPDWESVRLPEALIRILKQLHVFRTESMPVVILETNDTLLARDAAEAATAELGRPFRAIDLAVEPLAGLGRRIRLDQRLRPAGVFLFHCDALWNSDGIALPDARQLVSEVSATRGPIILCFTARHPCPSLCSDLRLLHLSLPEPNYDARRRLWTEAISQTREPVPPAAIEKLASRYRLGPRQIHSSLTAARDLRELEAPSQPLSFERISAAARIHTDHDLSRLARKVTLVYDWPDLVLPSTTMQQLHELIAAARHRELVYSEWGMAKGAPTGYGMKALFSGASGTGKTMTASVIARELAVDLYVIDLSAVVSKYIGETEKNLDRIFRAAHNSSAILFFDEADALFGKRSEVKDAHDRYANIEVAYLLQKMEEHDGLAILASNLSKNIDEAFSRRIQCVIEFPLPDEDLRLRIWKAMFPSQAPLGPDVDFEFLARQFRIPGGDIRNVAHAAAFLAADNSKVITMELLARAMARQMLKQGRIPSSTDFKQYHSLISSPSR